MNNKLNDEEKRSMLESIANISFNMREKIYLDYFDKLDPKYKCILALFDDSFMSSLMVCECLKNAAVAQSAVILRLLLESVSIIHIISEHSELLDEYRKHFNIRMEIASNPKKEREILKKHFPEVDDRKILSYMDYGWIHSLTNNSPSEKEMIKLANLGDVIEWKNQYLDKLTHQSFSTTNMIGESGDFPIVEIFIQILGKLFDYLCCDFHKLTNFDFVIDGKDMFQGWFRPHYMKLFRINEKN